MECGVQRSGSIVSTRVGRCTARSLTGKKGLLNTCMRKVSRGTGLPTTWGGVRIKSKSREVNIVWCHPGKGVELLENGSTEVDVWPVWLGLGPVAGTVVAMMKQGVPSPARRIYNVLTDLATITQVRSSSDLCYTEISEMHMGFPAD